MTLPSFHRATFAAQQLLTLAVTTGPTYAVASVVTPVIASLLLSARRAIRMRPPGYLLASLCLIVFFLAARQLSAVKLTPVAVADSRPRSSTGISAGTRVAAEEVLCNGPRPCASRAVSASPPSFSGTRP